MVDLIQRMTIERNNSLVRLIKSLHQIGNGGLKTKEECVIDYQPNWTQSTKVARNFQVGFGIEISIIPSHPQTGRRGRPLLQVLV